MQLNNRTVLITGGSGGIGLGLARAFHAAGSRVVVCGRDRDKLQAAERALPGLTAMACDVGSTSEREQLAREVLEGFPGLDVLVNNAGVQRTIDLKAGYADVKAGEDEIEINFTAVVELTGLLIGGLLGQASAEIINVSSALALMPIASLPVYCATKAALHTYSLALRQQLKDTAVRVVEVLPPGVETDLNRAGRVGNPNRHHGISVAEYMPSLIEGLESGEEEIFYGDGKGLMGQARGRWKGGC